MLHEQHCAVLVRCARAAQQVRQQPPANSVGWDQAAGHRLPCCVLQHPDRFLPQEGACKGEGSGCKCLEPTCHLAPPCPQPCQLQLGCASAGAGRRRRPRPLAHRGHPQPVPEPHPQRAASASNGVHPQPAQGLPAVCADEQVGPTGWCLRTPLGQPSWPARQQACPPPCHRGKAAAAMRHWRQGTPSLGKSAASEAGMFLCH